MNKLESVSSPRASSSKGGVQKLYTKLRHKISDNFNHHVSNDKTCKDAKTGSSESPSTATNIVCKVPNGNGNIDTNFRRTHGMLKHHRVPNKAESKAEIVRSMPTITLRRNKFRIINKLDISPTPTPPIIANPVAILADTVPPTSTPIPISVYGDSEDEYQFNVTTKSSLEDEIFEELEKAAHDETKLNAVLQNFDNILSEYKCCAFGTNDVNDVVKEQKEESPPLGQVLTKPNVIERPSATATTSINLAVQGSTLVECKITKVMSDLKRWNSYTFLDTKSCTPFIVGYLRTADFRTLDNIYSKSMPKDLMSLTLANKSYKNTKDQEERGDSSSYSRDLVADGGSNRFQDPLRSNSLCDMSAVILKTANTFRKNPSPPPRKRKNNIEGYTQINPVRSEVRSTGYPTATLKVYHSDNADIPAIPTPFKSTPTKSSSLINTVTRRDHSDVLLDKCLEKGHQILHKVETMQTITKTDNKNDPIWSLTASSLGKTLAPGKNKKQIFNYAYDTRLITPPLESCKIMPPIIGKTSIKNAELLVSVVQIKPPDSQFLVRKIDDNTTDCKKLAAAHETTTPSSVDSDDSGHISNDNEYVGNVESIAAIRLGKSVKIADLLRKFENHPKSHETENVAHAKKVFLPQKSPCISIKMAKVEAIHCIKTQIEIYPTYSKEVTIRLL